MIGERVLEFGYKVRPSSKSSVRFMVIIELVSPDLGGVLLHVGQSNQDLVVVILDVGTTNKNLNLAQPASELGRITIKLFWFVDNDLDIFVRIGGRCRGRRGRTGHS